MKRLCNLNFLVLTIGVMISAFMESPPCYAWTNGQNAAYVIGQGDFTTIVAGTSATNLNWPRDVALDAGNNKLYVVDTDNNRVLRYAYPITRNQPVAELVFGQPNFTSSGSGVSQNQLYRPSAVTVDDTGRLWVSDGNHRVIYFNNAYAISTNQPDAEGVLGQPDFTSNTAATTQNGMDAPYGLVVDSNGSLFVSDRNYNRVLRFDNAAAKANGANADGVLGQPDFTSNTAATTQNGMNSPRSVTLVGETLFVADRSNVRVLRFDNAAVKANGANADGVLGQPDFTSNTSHFTQNGMDAPGRVTADSFGRLYVSDGFFLDRVAIFNDVLIKPNGANADNVLGQPDFTSSGSACTQNRLRMDSSGGGAVFDSRANSYYLMIADSDNHRVMVFYDNTPPEPTITSISPTTGSTGTTVTITGTGFKGTEVKFGGTDAASFTVESSTRITAVVASGSTGKVTVVTDVGTATSDETFTYDDDPPTLDTETPSSYQVTVTKVEMFNGTDWVEIFSGNASLDMVAGGTFQGINDLNLAEGTYSKIRVTLNANIPVLGMATYGGNTYYTTAAAFMGQANQASAPTTVEGDKAAFTFTNPAGATHTFDMDPAITVNANTDYQPTLRFTISNSVLLKGTDGNSTSYYFTLDAPTVTFVEP